MIWDKLVDRCLLFTEAPGGLLKALLKEGEQELSNKLEIYDALYTMTVPTTDYGFGVWPHKSTAADHNYMKLPSNYIRDISVTHEGRKLRKISESEILRKTSNSIYSGTPTSYCISGDFIVFDTEPSSGDTFVLHYKKALNENDDSKVLTIFFYDFTNGYIYLDTAIGEALDNKKFVFENQIETLSAGTTTNLKGVAGIPDIYQGSTAQVSPGAVTSSEFTDVVGSRYNVTAFAAEGSLASSTWNDMNGALGVSLAYRVAAPVIPDRFHTNLCDYAIAIANAKTSPDTYNKYWGQWMLNLDNLINDAQDRDLIFSIREEI